jgi:hypothetical protein
MGNSIKEVKCNCY